MNTEPRGALLGVSISEVCAFALIFGLYNRKKKDLRELRRTQPRIVSRKSQKSLAGELLRIAIPITLGACIMPLVGLLDSLIVKNTMVSIDYSAFNSLDADGSFGVLTGLVNPLINMPAVLSLALCMSLVPAISESRAKRDDVSMSNRSAMGFKLAILIGLPCTVGMYLLSGPIIDLLYFSKNISDQARLIAANLLEILAVGVLFLTMLQTMTGILQGAGKQIIPVINLLIGGAVKVVLSLLLIRIPELNISGAAIGTAACYGIAALLNVAAVIKYSKPSIRAVSGIFMPVVSTAVMGLLIYFMYPSLYAALGNTKSTLLCIARSSTGIYYNVVRNGFAEKRRYGVYSRRRKNNEVYEQAGALGEIDAYNYCKYGCKTEI